MNYGLRPTKYDPRDFKSHKLPKLRARVLTLDDLPDDFLIDTTRLKDQKETDFCTAEAFTDMAEEQDQLEFSALWHFAKSKEASGEYKSLGSDIRTAGLVGVKKGFLLETMAFYNLDRDRDFLANWKNWPSKLAEHALPYRRKSLIKVTGPYDTFDNIRLELWKQHTKINIGLYWREDWWYTPSGLVSNTLTPRDPNNGHDIVICGWRIMNGSLRLVGKSSNGKTVGDKGFFYFTRDVINSESKRFGAYYYVNRTPEDIKREQWGLIVRLLDRCAKMLRHFTTSTHHILTE